MNNARLPKEFLLPEMARRDMQVTKGDRVEYMFVFLHEGDWPLTTNITVIAAHPLLHKMTLIRTYRFNLCDEADNYKDCKVTSHFRYSCVFCPSHGNTRDRYKEDPSYILSEQYVTS